MNHDVYERNAPGATQYGWPMMDRQRSKYTRGGQLKRSPHNVPKNLVTIYLDVVPAR